MPRGHQEEVLGTFDLDRSHYIKAKGQARIENGFKGMLDLRTCLKRRLG